MTFPGHSCQEGVRGEGGRSQRERHQEGGERLCTGCCTTPWSPRDPQQSPLYSIDVIKESGVFKATADQVSSHGTRAGVRFTGEEAGTGKGSSSARGYAVGFQTQVSLNPKPFLVPWLSKAKANCWTNIKRGGRAGKVMH